MAVAPEAARCGVLVCMNDSIHLALTVFKADSQLMGAFHSHPGGCAGVRRRPGLRQPSLQQRRRPERLGAGGGTARGGPAPVAAPVASALPGGGVVCRPHRPGAHWQAPFLLPAARWPAPGPQQRGRGRGRSLPGMRWRRRRRRRRRGSWGRCSSCDQSRGQRRGVVLEVPPGLRTVYPANPAAPGARGHLDGDGGGCPAAGRAAAGVGLGRVVDQLGGGGARPRRHSREMRAAGEGGRA